MYCIKCGKKIEYKSNFCKYCGAEIIFEKPEMFKKTNEKLTKKKKLIPQDIIIFVGSIVLFAGVFNLPYTYYNFLRVLISLISIYAIISKYKTSKIMLLFFMVSLSLFNPILKFSVEKNIWKIIDFIFGIVFMYASYYQKNNGIEGVKAIGKI